MNKAKEHEWKPLPSALLNEYETSYQTKVNEHSAKVKEKIINGFFKYHDVNVVIDGYIIGDSITRFFLRCDPTIKKRHIQQLIEDLNSKISGASLEFENNDSGELFPYIELANETPRTVSFKQMYNHLPNNDRLAFAFGRDPEGNTAINNLKNVPNMLVLGTEGSGDSMFLNSIITTLIMRDSPEDLKIALFDSKAAVFNCFESDPHLLFPLVTSYEDANMEVSKLFDELERRRNVFAHYYQENIDEYNEDAEMLGLHKLSRILIVINDISEFIKLDPKGTLIHKIGVLALVGRSSGIYVIVSARAFPNNSDANLKGYFKNKVAFKNNYGLINKEDEKKLCGHGDMLVDLEETDCKTMRIQGCYIHRKEIERVVDSVNKAFVNSVE